MFFQATDIKWIRNVTANRGGILAYSEAAHLDSFPLHWYSGVNPKNHPMKPVVGDIILMVQDGHCTHLVTPVDDKHAQIDENNPKFKWYRYVRTIAFADRNIPYPSGFNWNKSKLQWTFPFSIAIGDQEEYRAKERIWQMFKPFFREAILDNIWVEEEDLAVLEGAEHELMRNHKIRERSSALVAQKKREAIQKCTFFCECCGFDFSKAYPNIGFDFVECHHRVAIHKGERISRLEDLALVCSNCHRMLHRKNKDGQYFSIEALREILRFNIHYK